MAQAQTTALPFLNGSSPLIEEMQGPSGGSQQAYTLGKTLAWNSKDGAVGLAEEIRIRITGTVTPTLGAGAAIWSAMRSFFTTIRVKQGGTTIKEWHPFGYVLLRQRMRRNTNDVNAPTVVSAYSGPSATFPLGSALPAIVGAAAIPFAFTLVIPLRPFRHLMLGAMQCGDNTNPIVLECVTPASAQDVDPEAAPVIVSGGATVAFAANVNATYLYRRPFVYQKGVSVEAPVVGFVIRDSHNSVAISQVGSDIPISHKNLYPHIAIASVIEDGQSNAATGVTGLSTSEIVKFIFQLTEEMKVINCDTQNKINHYLGIQREIYGQDAPDGVFLYDPYLVNFGAELLTEPELQDPHPVPDFQIWSNAQTVFQLASGTVINTNPGIARIRTFSEYFLAVGY